MLEGKAVIQDTDMPMKMQIQAMSCASEALDLFDVLDCKTIAAHIKKIIYFYQIMKILCQNFTQCSKIRNQETPFKSLYMEFDEMYGGGWQCVVGSNFGCFFTHTKGTFIYFRLETLNFLIFKGATAAA